MSYHDKTVPCRDCGGELTFTAGEQEFYAQKGFMNVPTRCPAGRKARKEGGAAGGSGEVGDGVTPCPYDVSGSGRPPTFAGEQPRSGDRMSRGNDRGRSDDRAARGNDRGHFDDRAPRERPSYTGPLPAGLVEATVVRVDQNGVFMFVQVADPRVDVFVHNSLWQRLPRPPRTGDRVRVAVEANERGPRAISLEAAD